MVRICLLVHIYRSSSGAASGIQTLADRIEDQVVDVLRSPLEPERLTRYYIKRLEGLGHKVTLESRAAA
jgi:hypothetical protein